MRLIIKRDGLYQNYDFGKVKRVIGLAFDSLDKETPADFIDYVESKVNSIEEDTIAVEEMQDIIQGSLIEKGYKDVAKAFKEVREERNEIRQKKSKLIKEIGIKLRGLRIDNSNANVDESSFGGRKGEAIDIVCKNDALTNVMSRKSRKNHENNLIYIHDLASYSDGEHNCLTHPLDPVLAKGFKTRQCNVRPAGSVNTASQLVAVSFQLQSLQQFGGVSSGHLDWTMVPYIRKSFHKSYLAKYIETLDEFYDLDIVSMSDKELNDWLVKKIADFYRLNHELKDESAWKFDNKSMFDKKLYQQALFETRNEIYQAVEGLYHNLNTLQSRSGNQLPFSSINYGTCTLPEGRMYIKALLEVSIKGVGPNYTTPVFPCGIFQYMKGVNDKPGTPNYDLKRLALKATASRIYPNYANCDWTTNVAAIKQDREYKREVLELLSEEDKKTLISMMKKRPKVKEFITQFCYKIEKGQLTVDDEPRPSEITATMGCRTYNGGDVNANTKYFYGIIKDLIDTGKVNDYGLYSHAQKDGRGNLCPVTIIMPTVAMETVERFCRDMNISSYEEMIEVAHQNKEEIVSRFLKSLKKKIEDARDMLLERYEHICSQSPASAKYMYENRTMAGYNPEEGIVSALKHGTLAIGNLALAETLQILIGCNHRNPEGMAVAKEIYALFNKMCKEYKEEYQLNFGVYNTPAESLCMTAMSKFKKKYGILKNISEKEYFTNSMHIPVWEDVNCYEKIDLEGELTGYSNAGCITYTELPDGTKNNIDAIESLVDYAMGKNIPYFAINIPMDTCQECGNTGEFDVCPICGSKNIKRLRRITGYLSSDVSHFNAAKRAEEGDRIKHTDGKLQLSDC